MSNKMKIAINFIAFQLGWFSCVLMAAKDMVDIGISITLLLVLLHVILQKNRMNTILLLVVVTFIGSTWDSFLTHHQVLLYSSGMIIDYLAPSWIMMMWLIFSTTLTVSLRWLYGRYWLAMLMGAVFGPMAYIGGAALGAVIIPDLIIAVVALSIGWAVLMPLLIGIAESLEEYEPVKGEKDVFI